MTTKAEEWAAGALGMGMYLIILGIFGGGIVGQVLGAAVQVPLHFLVLFIADGNPLTPFTGMVKCVNTEGEEP